MKKMFQPACVAALLLISLASCQKEAAFTPAAENPTTEAAAYKSNTNDPEGLSFYALAGSTLDQYNTTNPESLLGSATVTGLQAGERILGLDFRPATGQLYALGSNSRLYTINPSTGVATLVAPLTTIPAGSTTPVPLSLSGSEFGFDFNPTVDRIRIISHTGQNLRAHPTTGITIIDGTINPMPAMVNGAAYTNNDTDPATGTKLFGFDPYSRTLYEVVPPNNGTLTDALLLKLGTTAEGGFDIAPRSASVTTDIALALYGVNGKSTLFRVDPETGATKIMAKYHKDVPYTALAISAAP
jgi:hypothetical protein